MFDQKQTYNNQKLVSMDNIQKRQQKQIVNKHKVRIFTDYFETLKVGNLLAQVGIRKAKGSSPLSIFTVVFNLSFVGKNVYEGIVRNKAVTIGKDAVYSFLNCSTYNWRRFTLLFFSRIYILIRNLLDDSKEEVLILDDTTYDRNRSKSVELLSKVFDHTTGRFIKGFRMLTLGWSDGNSFLGIDFALLSSAKEKNRYTEANPFVDQRTNGYRRRKEAVTKATELVGPMIARALALGVRAKYVVMDSWFSMPSLISSLRKQIHVICMLKDHPKWTYEYQEKKLRLNELYGKLKKTRGKSKVKASVVVKLLDGESARIIFVSCDKKRGWLALLSTELTLADEEIIRLYGKRWDIEVFFKMCKQHLKLVKEVQIRDYDGLIGHTSVVFARYNLLTLIQRHHSDQRSFGDLFRAVNDEMINITFIEALKRILTLAMASLVKTPIYSETAIQSILDKIMGYAIAYLGFKNGQEPLLAR